MEAAGRKPRLYWETLLSTSVGNAVKFGQGQLEEGAMDLAKVGYPVTM